MYILMAPSISPYSQAIRKATPVSTSPRRPPPTRVLVAAPALGAAVLVSVGVSVVAVLVAASLVDVVVLGSGVEVTIAVLKVVGRVEVSVIRLVLKVAGRVEVSVIRLVLKVVGRVEVSVIRTIGMTEDFAPAIAALALELFAARSLEADAKDAEAAD